MKKLYVVGIVAVFSFVFIDSDTGNLSSKSQSKSSCPYLNQIQKNHESNVCPYLEYPDQSAGTGCPYMDNFQHDSQTECPYLNGKDRNEIKVTVPPIKFVRT